MPGRPTAAPSSIAKPEAPTRSWTHLLVLLACLVFLAQELPFFQTRWVEDESSYADAAWTFSREGRIRMSMYPPSDLGSVVDVRPPATPIAMGGVYRVFGIGVWQSRLLPLVCSMATIILAWRLGFLLAGPWCGGLAALLLATDSMLFIAGRTARPEAMVAFLNTLVLLLFLLAIRRNAWTLGLFAGIVNGLAMNFHLNGIVAAVGMGLLALYEYRWNVWRKPVAWAFAVGLIACLVPYIVWVNADAVHKQAYREMQALGTLMQQGYSRLGGEGIRYSDFIGLGNQRVPMPIRVPLRAPVVVLILSGLVVLYRRKPSVFWSLALPVLAAMGWWVNVANKSARYTAVIAPLFAVIVAAAAVAFATSPRRRQIAALACILYAANQLFGNVFLVWRYRNVDYVRLTEQLRSVVPVAESVYGANTFWLALHDRRYYSYDRALFDYTVANLKPRYMILNDRLMLHGSGYGNDDFGEVRTKSNLFVQTHGRKVAAIADDFYGNLAIYSIGY